MVWLDIASLELPFYQFTVTFIILWTIFDDFYLERRQFRQYLRVDIPSRLKDSLSEATLRKTNAYHKDKAVFGAAHSAFQLALTLATLHYGFLAWLWSSSWGVEGEMAHSLLFALQYMLLMLPISWPWSLYKAFVIEERHGFNKMTLRTWILDQLKGLLLGSVLGGFVLTIVILITRWAGDYFYIYAYAFFVAFQLFVYLIYFDYIAPLFNSYKALEQGPLLSAINELCARLGFPLKNVYVMDGSARSAHSNAFFFGFGGNKRIVLYDTLIEKCNKDQIMAVLAHELGHWNHSHTLALLVLQLALFAVFFLLWGAVSLNTHLFAQFGFHHERPVVIGLILFTMIVGPLDSLIDLGINLLSRRFEYQADVFAANLGYDLSDSLIALNESNLGAIHVDHWYSFVHNSHPTLLERLDAMDKKGKKSK